MRVPVFLRRPPVMPLAPLIVVVVFAQAGHRLANTYHGVMMLAMAWMYRLADEKKVKATRTKAEGGNGYAMWRLGAWYQHGERGLVKDSAQARAWYERSAATRDPMGLSSFGSCLLRGAGGPQNTSLGLVYITDGAHLGSNFGAYTLGKAFFAGRHGLPEDRVQARFWLKKAVDKECKFTHLADTAEALAATWLRELNE